MVMVMTGGARGSRLLSVGLVLAAASALAIGVAGAAATLVRLSTDPYTNASSQHRTEVEPDSFAFGSTMVAAFQVGRFFDGGASNVGYATSTNAGATWTNGFLPGTTTFATPAGPFGRVSDPSVAYDAKHGVWIISSLAIDTFGNSIGPIASRSLDGGLTFQSPVSIAAGSFPDKEWIVCDNTPTSAFYGNCYVQWDDAGAGNRVEMNTSSDGGLTWGTSRTTADNASGLGGQPLVRPNGTVVVPVSGNFGRVFFFTSSNGGASWSASKTVADQTDHVVAANIRTEPLPSAEIDKKGRVFVAWQDCRFRVSCSSNDIVYAIIKPTDAVTAVQRVPIDPTTSTVDHFAPGLAVDRTTARRTVHLALTYYYFPVANCGSNCQLRIGFVSSNDTGKTWSTPSDLDGAMNSTWLANTNQGRMFGDYISTSFVNGKAFPAMIVANAPVGSLFDEAAYTTAAGLFQTTPGTLSAAGDQPVPNAASDHPPVAAPTAN
jgi:hypothetical protein